jgi:hypothetical protein
VDRVTPNAVYFFIGARRIVLFGAGRYENGYARARTLAKQCLENRRRLDVQATQAIRGHTQMTEVEHTPSGLGADHVAQDGLAHLDTTVWWLYSTGLIVMVALDKFLELRYDLLPAALSYFLPHEIGRDARSELLLFSSR